MSKIHSLKNIALALSIAIVLNVFIGVGVSSFYPAPEFSDFCAREKVQPRVPFEEQQLPSPEQIEENQRCNEEFQTARDLYNRNVFLVFLVGGLIALGSGWTLNSAPAVAAGLTYGGVLAFLVGTIRWWSGMQDVLRFVIVGIILIVLIWLGTRKRQKTD